MSFQLYSDIHTELKKGKFPEIPPKARNLILAGDIGNIKMENFKNFIRYCSERWEHIFFVFGNHEFYASHSIKSLKNQYRKYFEEFPNIHLLDSEYFILDGIAIYGFIAWTRPLFNTASLAKSHGLNDYYKITTIKGSLKPKDIEQMVNEELSKFKDFILKVNNSEIECNSVLIVTHFPPLGNGTSNPIYNNNYLNRYFSWLDLLNTENISCNKIKVWCSGHTHWSYDFIKSGIRFLSNQIGYSDEETNFNDGIFTISSI